jgi:hypothetical protein
MKRDTELVRTILLKIEEKDDTNGWLSADAFSEHSKELICYHYKILSQAGYIEVVDLSSKGGVDIQVKNLTWEGHEFLDASRNISVWQKAKKKFGSEFKTIPFQILKEVLIELNSQRSTD